MTDITPELVAAAKAEIVRGQFALAGIVLPLVTGDGREIGVIRDDRGEPIIIVDEPGAMTDADTLAVARQVVAIINAAGGFT